jgi:dolichol-phosphate mannosyltransferase
MLSPAKNAPALSIVFSFRNEEHVLPELIRRVRIVMGQALAYGLLGSYELIFVNDDSTDQSLNILIQHAAQKSDIRIVNMSRNFGVAPCVMAGLSYAMGDVAIYMDTDLQDPPELILEMLKAWQDGDGVEVVHTVRRSRKGESAFKMLITRIGYSILNRYCSVSIPREAGDFKLLSRKVVDHLLRFKEQNPFMRGLVCWVGFKQVFVPYDRQERFAGKSKFFVLSKKVISNFFNSAIVNFSAVPLQIASYLGLAAIFIDLILFIQVVMDKFQNKAVSGSTAIMIAILLFGGVQLFCIGMIGLYLNSVHEQSKMRPLYIVESTFGFPQKTPHA